MKCVKHILDRRIERQKDRKSVFNKILNIGKTRSRIERKNASKNSFTILRIN